MSENVWELKYFSLRDEMIDLIQRLSEEDLSLIVSLVGIITRMGGDEAVSQMNEALNLHGKVLPHEYHQKTDSSLQPE